MQNKIVIDGSSLLLKSGAGTYVNLLVSGLAKIKVSPNILIIIIIPFGFKGKLLSKKNIKIIKKPFINKVIWDLILLPSYCWLQGASLLHYTENTGGSFLPKILSINTLLTIHDVSYYKSFHTVSRPSSIRQWIGLYYRRFCTKRIATNCKKIFTVSKFAKEDIIKELEISPKKIHITKNALSEKYLAQRLCPSGKKIIMVTGPSNQKNINFTLSCLLKNKDILTKWKILIIGVKGKDSNFMSFKRKISNEKLVRYYDQSSILIMPSLYESFSIPIIEALSRGLSVISSNRGAAPEVLKNYGLFYNPLSCKELRKNLISVIKKKQLTKKSFKNKAKLYALSFTDKKLAKNTLHFYKKIIQSTKK